MNGWTLGYFDPQVPAQIPSMLAAIGGILLIGWRLVRSLPSVARSWRHRLCGRRRASDQR